MSKSIGLGVADVLMHHALEPLTALVPDAANTFTNGDDGLKSIAHLLLEVLGEPITRRLSRGCGYTH